MTKSATIKKASISIKFASSTGSRSEYSAQGGTGTRNSKTGEEVSAIDVMIDALAHLAFVTSAFGAQGEALAAFTTAQERAATWKAERGGEQNAA